MILMRIVMNKSTINWNPEVFILLCFVFGHIALGYGPSSSEGLNILPGPRLWSQALSLQRLWGHFRRMLWSFLLYNFSKTMLWYKVRQLDHCSWCHAWLWGNGAQNTIPRNLLFFHNQEHTFVRGAQVIVYKRLDLL